MSLKVILFIFLIIKVIIKGMEIYLLEGNDIMDRLGFRVFFWF